MKNNQKYKGQESGFIPVETILIVVIVGIMGFVGWFVMHSKHKTDSLLAGSDKVSSSAQLNSNLKTQAAKSPSSTQTSAASNASQKTSTSVKSTPKTSTEPAVSHPTTQDVDQAAYQVSSIQGLLEAYYATNNSYPNDLSPDPLLNQPGISGFSANTFVAPQGTSFTYGCTKGAGNTCLGYLLQALKSDGTVIRSLTNQF